MGPNPARAGPAARTGRPAGRRGGWARGSSAPQRTGRRSCAEVSWGANDEVSKRHAEASRCKVVTQAANPGCRALARERARVHGLPPAGGGLAAAPLTPASGARVVVDLAGVALARHRAAHAYRHAVVARLAQRGIAARGPLLVVRLRRAGGRCGGRALLLLRSPDPSQAHALPSTGQRGARRQPTGSRLPAEVPHLHLAARALPAHAGVPQPVAVVVVVLVPAAQADGPRGLLPGRLALAAAVGPAEGARGRVFRRSERAGLPARGRSTRAAPAPMTPSQACPAC